MEINNFSAAPQRRGKSNKARTVARRRSIREQADGGSVSDAPPARCHAEATAAFPSLLLLLVLLLLPPPPTHNTPTALFSPVTSSRSAASD
ncbi:hypothetical protein FQA47_018794 [Oryzias melastigma]|uniref:Uncharacterized protein n=1 Tax=Oryzias melastigma TaxID=30732 RepID=A0A834BIR9_ORYME|nr:hypothetical protein FQA47_018794 [Oryzias melastigma]